MKKINAKGPIISNNLAGIYKWLGWDACAPADIQDALAEAGGEDVVLEINSTGGQCMYAYEMYTAIMEYTGRVTAHVVCACSAATLLACAADEALISDAGLFMIHNTRSATEGDYRDMEAEADALLQFNDGIINAYVKKTGMERSRLQELMDKETYMSPQRAIEYGFVDGYIFGGLEQKDEGRERADPAADIVAAFTPVIPEDKARAIMAAAMAESLPVPEPEAGTGRKDGPQGKTDRTEEGKVMSLEEFLKEHPEAQMEVNALVDAAKNEAEKKERERMQSLDAIAGMVTAEMLKEAKYGDEPVDGKTLAYQAMLKDNALAKNYMRQAEDDAEESRTAEVGIGMPDVGEEAADEADELAAHINQTRGGRKL